MAVQGENLHPGGDLAGQGLRGLRTCQGGWGHAYARGGTTIGSTYLAKPGADHVRPEVLMHETVHVQQWRAWGPLYPAAYGAAGGNACTNAFEIQAGLKAGHYTC